MDDQVAVGRAEQLLADRQSPGSRSARARRSSPGASARGRTRSIASAPETTGIVPGPAMSSGAPPRPRWSSHVATRPSANTAEAGASVAPAPRISSRARSPSPGVTSTGADRIGEHRDREPLLQRIEHAVAHAVIGRQTADVQVIDAARVQVLEQRPSPRHLAHDRGVALIVDALALGDDRGRARKLEVLAEACTLGALHAVHGPLAAVRGEVRALGRVPVARGVDGQTRAPRTAPPAGAAPGRPGRLRAPAARRPGQKSFCTSTISRAGVFVERHADMVANPEGGCQQRRGSAGWRRWAVGWRLEAGGGGAGTEEPSPEPRSPEPERGAAEAWKPGAAA